MPSGPRVTVVIRSVGSGSGASMWFTNATATIGPEGNGARIRFHPPTDPRLVTTGNAQVACLLYG